jgi:hypothetical protein
VIATALLILLAAEPSAPATPSVPPVPPSAATNQVPAPVFATKGYTKPDEARRGCIAKRLRMPNGNWDWGTVTLKFAVRVDGSGDSVELLSDKPPPPELVSAFAEAVRQCEFIPGRDPSGKPVATWMILPFGFSKSP